LIKHRQYYNYHENAITLGKNSLNRHYQIAKPNNMRQICIALIFGFVLFSCKKDNGSSSKDSMYSISGVAQKGPFVQGSKVTVYELNIKFEQTGKVFTTETSDDYGSFSLKDILLTSSIVQVEVQGNSYNEFFGGVQTEEMILSNIVDLKEGITINVNLLSDLSRQRFKYLVQNGGSFDQAKIQAEKEVMKAFGLDSFYVTSSEKMDITKADDASGSLLALSALFLTARYQQSMFLQQLAAKFRSDFETDGILSDTLLIYLIREAFYIINPDIIKNSLSDYYKKDIASFSKYVNIAKQKFFNLNPYTGSTSTDIILSDIVGNLLILPNDTSYLPLSYYNIAFAFPAHIYKKVRLTLSFTGDMGWYLSPGTNWEYISGNEGQYVSELKGVGLASNFVLQNLKTNTFYLLFEDITESPSKILAQKWIGFGYP
jgi:hypothetical protein